MVEFQLVEHSEHDVINVGTDIIQRRNFVNVMGTMAMLDSL